MPNRQLTKDELPKAINLLNEVRTKLLALAGEDKDVLFAFRRKLFKELIYDERSKPDGSSGAEGEGAEGAGRYLPRVPAVIAGDLLRP